MGHLFIVVMSVVLLSIVVVGGINYISSDVGARTDAVRQIATSRNAIEGAIASYRMANRGTLPPADMAWKAALDGYIARGGYDVPEGLTWRYLPTDGGQRVLCLEATAPISKALQQALERSAVGAAQLGTACPGDEGEVAAALVVPLQHLE